MADPGSIDDFLSSEIDENAVNALVGSLETQLASPASTQASKNLTESSYNNNHIGGTTSTSSSVRPLFLTNQTVIPNQKGSVSNNSTLNSHVSVSSSKLSNAEILGISSIINSSSTPVSTGGVSHVNVNTSLGSNGRADGQKISAPTIRIVTQPSSTPISSTNAQYISSGGCVISRATVPTGVSNNVHGSSMGVVTRTNVTAASSTIYNLANTIAAEQKPVTVVHNGSAHPIQVTKDHAVISQQGFLVKQEGGATLAIKPDGSHTNQQFIVKQDPGTPAAVHLKQEVSGVSVAHSGTQLVNTTLKGMGGGVSNPSIITVRAHPHPQQVTVVQQPAVVTTQASMTQPMQVVSVAGAQGAPRLASVAPPNVVKPGMRVTTPMRITQQPNIAPRQPGPPVSSILKSGKPFDKNVTLPPGALLMRNEQGQLMLVQTGQPPSTALHPSSVITTTAVPITTSTGFKIQRPVTTANIQRPTGNTIVIQPSGQTRQPVTLTQPPGSRIISQPTPNMPAPSIAQPQPAVVATNTAAVPECSKMMAENVKKCKNFLSTLLKLAASQPTSTIKRVRDLIQGLIDSKIEPEIFTQKLQHELKSSPQPYLVPFLKKSLPMLRQSMQAGRMGIEGIRAPPHEVVVGTTTAQTPPAAIQRQQIASQPAAVVRPPMTTQAGVKQPKLFQGTTRLALPQKITLPSTSPLVQQHKPQPIPTATSATVAMAAKSPAPAALRPPLSQLGPASSKVLMQASRPAPSPAASASRIKPGASAAVTAALQAHQAHKAEAATPTAPQHKEKRKFDALKDDNDDINDVATMGGVNLSEESKNILATNSDLIGSQIRSCQDKTFLPQDLLMSRIAAIAKKRGLEGVSPDVCRIMSHATQDRLRDLISRLSTVAEHRVEGYKMDNRYEVSAEVRSKLKFLEDLEKLEKKRHEDQERELLLRAIKSRSKNEDPEQLKLKQKARELQQAEAEELRQREANLTALAAIGPRKKRKLDLSDSALSGSSSSSNLANGPSTSSNRQSVIGRPRIKRVTLKDMQFVMEADRHLCKSTIYFKSFLK